MPTERREVTHFEAYVRVQIRAFRTLMCFSQSKIARRLGWSRQQYLHVESGRTRLHLDAIYEIAKCLGIDPASLLSGYVAPDLSPGATPIGLTPEQRTL